MKKIYVILLAFLLLLPSAVLADLEAHFLDVGQGDCAIVICDGESMVIDGGPGSASSKLFSYLRNTLKLRHIDYMVSTHPHVDHVYGLSSVLNVASVDVILTPVTEWDSKAFTNLLKYAKRQNTPLVVPSDGDTFRLGGADVTILQCWPEAIDHGRTNDSSIVLRIDYGSTSFLFTGDAEDWTEYMLIDAGANLKADVLKVSHHGSRTASTGEFLRQVTPTWAVISCGKDNSYGHPHEEVLENLAAVGACVLRTDQRGTIVIRSDGQELSVREDSKAQRAADKLEAKTGIRILYGVSCAGKAEDGLSFSYEDSGTTAFSEGFGTVDYTAALQKLDGILEGYPEGFLHGLSCPDGEKGLRILLAGGIRREAEGRPRPENLFGRVYVKDGYSNMALAADLISEETVHHELWHAIEKSVLAKDPDAFSEWDSLNPPGFRYDPEAAPREEDGEWFAGDKGRAYAAEDRAEVWAAIRTKDETWWQDKPNLLPKRETLIKICETYIQKGETKHGHEPLQ